MIQNVNIVIIFFIKTKYKKIINLMTQTQISLKKFHKKDTILILYNIKD